MKTIKEWLKAQPKSVYFLTGIAILAIVLLMITRCNSRQQQQENVNVAVLQHDNENLQGVNSSLLQQLAGHKAIEDSLKESVKKKDNYIAKLNQKLIIVDNKYQKKLKEIREVNDDSAVAIFLDNAECGELPILKYKKDNDSGYIIPACPIRTYNDLKVGFDMQVDVNSVLVEKIQAQSEKVNLLNTTIAECDKQVALQDSIIENDNVIQENQKGIIASQDKSLKAQKRKTWTVGILGGLATLAAIIF